MIFVYLPPSLSAGQTGKRGSGVRAPHKNKTTLNRWSYFILSSFCFYLTFFLTVTATAAAAMIPNTAIPTAPVSDVFGNEGVPEVPESPDPPAIDAAG